jgi:hypothetical protein
MDMTAKLQEIEKQVQSAIQDGQKTVKGNESAGVRVRKSMNVIRRLAFEIRKDVLDFRKPK